CRGRENVSRFKLNRRWTFIVTLSAALVVSALTHRPASCDGVGVTSDPRLPPGGGDGVGDPGSPTGPSKSARTGQLTRGGTSYGTRSAGDGRVTTSVLVWRLRVVLSALRVYFIRF